MTTLTERLEAATEGSRVLSDEVLMAFGWHKMSDDECVSQSLNIPWDYWEAPNNPHGRLWRDSRPCPTTSIDAALTLAPGPTVEGDKGRKIEIVYSEWIPQASATVNYEYNGFARTPALALCIAALKARGL